MSSAHSTTGMPVIEESDLEEAGADKEKARRIREVINAEWEPNGPEGTWKRLSKDVLSPDDPASLHVFLFQQVYGQDGQFSDAPPAWWPSNETLEQANLTRVMRALGSSDITEFYTWSISDRKGFWEKMTEELEIVFKQGPSDIVSFENGVETPDWYPGASLNIVDTCFKRESRERAIVFGKEDGSMGEWSYGELEEMVNRVVSGLQSLGFEKGMKAAVNMPMTAEAVAIYLGVIKAGGAVVSIADSIAAAEVEKRTRIAVTDLIFTQDVVVRGGKELPLFGKLNKVDIPRAVVLPGKENTDRSLLREGDRAWEDFLGEAGSFDSVPCEPADLCNVLFSSGTTGEPKAIPWTHSTPVKCAMDGYLHQDIQQGEVVAWPTNIGWMMGPWLIFAALMNKATIALYYGAPVGRDFGQFVEKAGVNMLGVVPSMVKKWNETGCMKGLDWRSIKVFSSTGESSNPQDYLWLMARGGYRPVIEYCGGTEVGGGYATGTVVQPASPGSFSTPAFGLDVYIADENGDPADKGEGFLVPPSIGLSNTLLNKDHHEVYYAETPEPDPRAKGISGVPLEDQFKDIGTSPILRRHGDELEQLPNGFLRPRGRADDTMNLGGIKTSSVEIERLLDLEERVHETAAIAVETEEGGPSRLVICAVPKEDPSKVDRSFLIERFQRIIKDQLNPLFKIYDVVLMESLPRTASNKIMRRILRADYEGSG